MVGVVIATVMLLMVLIVANVFIKVFKVRF